MTDLNVVGPAVKKPVVKKVTKKTVKKACKRKANSSITKAEKRREKSNEAFKSADKDFVAFCKKHNLKATCIFVNDKYTFHGHLNSNKLKSYEVTGILDLNGLKVK